MQLEKAIETLILLLAAPVLKDDERCTGALSLGIEALKRIQDMRISPCTTADEILPGETKYD